MVSRQVQHVNDGDDGGESVDEGGESVDEGGESEDEPLGEGALRAVYHAVNDAIFVHDVEGNVLDVNETAAAMYGYTREEFRTGDPPETSAGDGPFSVEASFERLLDVREGEPETFEWKGKDRDGNVFWEEVSVGETVVDGERRLIAIVRDIDERKRSEQELEYRRALLEAQAEATIDGFLVEHGGEVLSYNSRFMELFDVPAEQPPGSDATEALDVVVERVAEPGAFREVVERLADSPDAEARDEVELSDGRWIDWYSSPVESQEGDHYGRLWVFRDVTDLMARERELRRKNERLDEFASMVSHDLRNPLNVASGHLELARDADPGDDLHEHLDGVRRAHERMDRLIEDLLTLAREGRVTEDLESVALAAFAEQCWQNVDTRNATLRTETDAVVLAAERRLPQLFENLFRNAVEYGGGTVTVTVGSLPDGFYVEDDGPGIPAADRDRVFESGFSTSTEGNGYGLSIVEDIVDEHGWTVRVTTGEAGGARFELSGVEHVE